MNGTMFQFQAIIPVINDQASYAPLTGPAMRSQISSYGEALVQVFAQEGSLLEEALERYEVLVEEENAWGNFREVLKGDWDRINVIEDAFYEGELAFVVEHMAHELVPTRSMTLIPSVCTF